MTQKNYFITFEGGEGTGKSTQIQLLTDFLKSLNLPVVLTREPGGCEIAEKIRNLLVKGHKDDLDDFSELLLFSAARHEHIRQKIRPSLNENKWVISDRFYLSTYVYQGYAGGLDVNLVKDITSKAIKGTEPDLIILLDLDTKKGLNRALARQENSDETRMEGKALQYHQKVRDGFLKAAESDKRVVVINADQSIEQVHQDIIEQLKIRKFI